MSEAFDHLLQAAKAQPHPQRLVFVFATAGLPDDATPAQRESFEQGHGGTLSPLMCVDKAPHELSSFQSLVEESRRAGPPWQVMFVAAVGGVDGQPPNDKQIEAALARMVDGVHQGAIQNFMAFNPQGELLHLG